jgi:hypothetical protein
VSTRAPNGQGLILRIDDVNRTLIENCNRPPPNVAIWRLDTLHRDLLVKHPQTLWIQARAVRDGNDELFYLQRATYTRTPSVAQFDALLLEGVITVDHRIHRRADNTLRDHGIPFRISPSRTAELFLAKPVKYQLAN